MAAGSGAGGGDGEPLRAAERRRERKRAEEGEEEAAAADRLGGGAGWHPPGGPGRRGDALGLGEARLARGGGGVPPPPNAYLPPIQGCAERPGGGRRGTRPPQCRAREKVLRRRRGQRRTLGR